MKKTEKGFTLIELLIVIAIIGVLAVAFLPSLLGAPAKARDAQRQAQVQKIQSFLVSEALLNPSALKPSGCISEAAAKDGTIGGLIKDNLSAFGGVYPQDPSGAEGGNKLVALGDACKGGYMYIKYTGADNDYDFALVAEVENDTNANVPCAGDHFNPANATSDQINTVLNNEGGDVDDPQVNNCYAVFVST